MKKVLLGLAAAAAMALALPSMAVSPPSAEQHAVKMKLDTAVPVASVVSAGTAMPFQGLGGYDLALYATSKVSDAREPAAAGASVIAKRAKKQKQKKSAVLEVTRHLRSSA